MLYMILGRDVPDSLELRAAARTEHLQRLSDLQAQGRLILAGPLPRVDAADLSAGVSGSLVVAEFTSLIEAREWAEAEPYLRAGVFSSVEVLPFIKVLPA